MRMMSAQSPRARPPPTAWPSIAAIPGTGTSRTAFGRRMSAGSSLPSRIASSSSRDAPLENTSGRPSSTATRASAQAASARSASDRSRTNGSDIAFPPGGSDMVTVAMPRSSTSNCTARVLTDCRGGPRYGPPASSSEGGYAPLGLPRPSRGRAPAQPWRASGSTQDVSSAAVARRRDLQERHRAGAAGRVLGQAAVPAGQVLLLNEDRRERGGHARVVRRLRVALEPQCFRHAAGFLARGVAPALRARRRDLGLALGLDQLVALLLGLLLLDLLGLDGLLVVGVEADVGQRGFLQLDAVLGQPLCDAGLHVELDGLPPHQDLCRVVRGRLRLEDLLRGRVDDDAGVIEADGLVDFGRAVRYQAVVQHHLHMDGLEILGGGVVARGVLLHARVHDHDVVERVPDDVESLA